MESTIIINKTIMHMCDLEHRKTVLSDNLIEQNEESLEYFKKKLCKAVNSSSKKEIVVGSMHELLVRSKNMTNNDDTFIEETREITKKIYQLATQIEMMPNFNIVVYDCYIDGCRFIYILKLNYKLVPCTSIQDNMVKLTYKQMIPNAGSAIEEAIIIDCENSKLYLIEKKFEIDGKKDFYLNPQWIKGECLLSDKDKLKLAKKVVKKIDSIYQVTNNTALPEMKRLIQEKRINNESINAIDLVKTVLKDDYQAEEESESMLRDLGISENDTIESVDGKLDLCKIKINDNIVITMPVEDYISGDFIRKTKKEDGTFEVSIVAQDLKVE